MESLRNGVKSQLQPQERENEHVSKKTIVNPDREAGFDVGEDTLNFLTAEDAAGMKRKNKKKRVKSENINGVESEGKTDLCIEQEAEKVANKKKSKKREKDTYYSKSSKKHLHSNEEDVHCEPVSNKKNEERKKKTHSGTSVEENSISDGASEENSKIKKKKRKYINVNEEMCSSHTEVQKHNKKK